MVISEERKADAVVLALSGRLDAMSGKTFEDRILGVIHSGTQRLVLDLPTAGVRQQLGPPCLSRRGQGDARRNTTAGAS
jgi:hypothetical protein